METLKIPNFNSNLNSKFIHNSRVYANFMGNSKQKMPLIDMKPNGQVNRLKDINKESNAIFDNTDRLNLNQSIAESNYHSSQPF